jgi:hypothetical protein
MSQGVSSAPMREQHQRLGSGELESFPRPRPCTRASDVAKNFPVEGCLPSRSRTRRIIARGRPCLVLVDEKGFIPDLGTPNHGTQQYLSI